MAGCPVFLPEGLRLNSISALQSRAGTRDHTHNGNILYASKQYRAARALLGWTQAELALSAGIPERAVDWLEYGNPRGAEYAGSLVETLEANGIVFLDATHDSTGPLTAVAIFDTPPAIKPILRLTVEDQ